MNNRTDEFSPAILRKPQPLPPLPPRPAVPEAPAPYVELTFEESPQVEDLNMQLGQLAAEVSRGSLKRVAEIVGGLSYGDMMRMATALAARAPKEASNAEAIAAWLFDWATEEKKAAK